MTALTRRDVLRAGAAGALALWLPFEDVRQAAASDDGGALGDLAGRLKGKLLLPADSGYRDASQPSNTRYEKTRPLAVAQCANEQDVVTCVNWAREHGVRPVARGGGHSYAGYSTTKGLLIDVGRLSNVKVNQSSGVARVGGGALNENLRDATSGGNWFLPGGTCLGVGIGGLVLGGGIGYNTHWAGLTSDHLRSSRIVVASGEVLDIDASHHKDLFWACRGGAGGSFGINTSFEFELAAVPPQDVSFYRFEYRGDDDAAAVLSAFDRMLQTAPVALNAVAASTAAPVGKGGPREAINTFTRGQYIGPLTELWELVAPLLALKPVKATLETFKFWDMQRVFSSRETERHSYGDISRYSEAPLPDEVVAKVVGQLANCPHRDEKNNGSFWSLGWIGGDVVDSVGRTDTAYVHRNMLTMLRPTPVWETNAPEGVGDDLVGWAQDVIATIEPNTPNESYQNFPNRRILDWKQQYYAENYPRLVDVKTEYDPKNLFRNKQSIRVHPG